MGKTQGQGKGAHFRKKQRVVALVERRGRVHVSTVTTKTLKPILEGQIAKTARFMTDTSPVYTEIGKSFASHETVNHLAKEYARGDVTTNSVEGFCKRLTLTDGLTKRKGGRK